MLISESQRDINVKVASDIFREHGDFIREVIRYRVQNQALAEDMYQDVFLTLSSNPVPENVKNIRGYLFYLITKDIIDSMRRVIQYKQNLKKYADYCLSAKANPKTSDLLCESEEVEKIFRSIEKLLLPSEAHAIKLRFKDGYNSQDAANKMDIKPRSFHRYIAMGLTKIRKIFLSGERVSS